MGVTFYTTLNIQELYYILHLSVLYDSQYKHYLLLTPQDDSFYKRGTVYLMESPLNRLSFVYKIIEYLNTIRPKMNYCPVGVKLNIIIRYKSIKAQIRVYDNIQRGFLGRLQ
jgi:hypothetical protein